MSNINEKVVRPVFSNPEAKRQPLTCPVCNLGELKGPKKLRIRAMTVHDGVDFCSHCLDCDIWFYTDGSICGFKMRETDDPNDLIIAIKILKQRMDNVNDSIILRSLEHIHAAMVKALKVRMNIIEGESK